MHLGEKSTNIGLIIEHVSHSTTVTYPSALYHHFFLNIFFWTKDFFPIIASINHK